MQKKVLIISYLFPPIGGGGVQRALKMAKYLTDYGWEPHILTVSEDVYFASKDDSLLQQLPANIHIHRANQLDIIGKFATTNNRQVRSNLDSAATEKNTSLIHKIKLTLKPLLKRLKNYILIPDEQIIWKNNAVRLGLDIIGQHNIQALFSTSGPNTNHLVAYHLKQRSNLPWIADFRDPWTDNMHRSGILWREKLEAVMEAKVVQSADVLMTVTNSFLKMFNNKYAADIKKSVVVYNGYDLDDYQEIVHNKKKLAPKDTRAKMCFVYTGIFYEKRNPRLFLQAVAELINEGVLAKEKLELHFAGIFDYPGQNANWQAVVEFDLQQQVVIHGQLPHKQALQLLADADVQLLIADAGESAGAYIPGKLFEYIAIGKPILALSQQGESTQIIESLERGLIACPTSLAEIKSAVSELYRTWSENESVSKNKDFNNELLKKYQRSEQARQLAEQLDDLTNNYLLREDAH